MEAATKRSKLNDGEKSGKRRGEMVKQREETTITSTTFDFPVLLSQRLLS